MSALDRKHQHVQSVPAGAELPDWMRTNRHRRLVFAGIGLFVVSFWACVLYAVAVAVTGITSVPVLVMQLVDAVVVAR